VYNLEYIKERPFLGWGLSLETRFMDNSGDHARSMSNGLADFTAAFGLIGLLTVLTSIWIGVYELTGRKWVVTTLFVLFVVIELNGDRLLNYSTYLGLMFLGSRLKRRSTVPRFQTPNSVLIKRTGTRHMSYLEI